MVLILTPTLTRCTYMPDMIPQEAAKSFSRFFQEKIEKIRQEFSYDPSDTTENFASSVYSSDMLSSFYALSEDQILKLICESKVNHSDRRPGSNQTRSWIHWRSSACVSENSHIWHCANCFKKSSG